MEELIQYAGFDNLDTFAELSLAEFGGKEIALMTRVSVIMGDVLIERVLPFPSQ